MKDRVIESEEGRFYPQHKRGFLSFWKFYRAGADTSPFMLARMIVTEDPGEAAHFTTEADARAFLARMDAKVAAYFAEAANTRRRSIEGVKVKRVVDEL